MQFRAKDYYFIFSLLFLIILVVIFFFQQIRENKLNEYLELMHEKLSEMIEDEKTRDQLDKIYREFTNQAREGKLNSKEIEKVAENIVDLRKKQDKIATADLRNILPVKETKPAELFSSMGQKVEDIDWQKLASRFEDSCRRCDSLKISQDISGINSKHFAGQIKLHEKISRVHQINAQKAREDFNKIKEKLSKLKILPERMEIELKNKITELELENEKLDAKINSIDKIKNDLENERRKLIAKLSCIDTVSPPKSVPATKSIN